MTQTKMSPTSTPNADIVTAPGGNGANAVVTSNPLPPTSPDVTMTPVTPTPPAMTAGAEPTPVVDAGGYPNINIAPKQPQQSQLLSPEERAKLIEELNALAGRTGSQ